MQALHPCSSTPLRSSSGVQWSPQTSPNSLHKHRLCTRAHAAKKSKGSKKGARQQQQHTPQTDGSAWTDPRLQWARPEWIQQKADKQQTPTASVQQQQQQQQPPSSSAQPRVPQPQAAAAAVGSSLVSEREQQFLLQRMTYGSFSSSDDEDEAGSLQQAAGRSPTSVPSGSVAMPQPYQALGVDFGLARVGVAVRQATHNIPLTTLWPQQLQDGDSSNTTSSSSSGPRPPPQGFDYSKLAGILLSTALEQGCDGFVVGLPVFDLAAQQRAAGADAPASSAAAAVAAAAAAGASAAAGGSGQVWRSNSRIRRFAQVLANVAAAYELPVLLVNEQQSTRQAKAVRSGKAAYDIITQQELQQEQQQQQPQGPGRPQQGRQPDPGKDAYAAALILSRYYNGLVQPVEVVQPQPQPQPQQQQPQAGPQQA